MIEHDGNLKRKTTKKKTEVIAISYYLDNGYTLKEMPIR